MNWSYVLIPLFVVAVGLIGSVLTDNGLRYWYRNLKKPRWTPRGKTIAGVWTVLYLFATVSALVFWNDVPRGYLFDLIVFAFVLNAAYNVFWSYLFFDRHYVRAAVVDSVALEITILDLIFLLWPVSKISAILLFPYALWVAFATYLNWKILHLNAKKS